MKAGNQTSLKKNNQQAIAEYIIRNGPISRADLSKKLKISKPTVSANMAELIENDVLREIGYNSTDVGKKPMLVDFNRNYRYILALDFISEYSSNKVIAAICNLYCEPVYIEEITLPDKFSAIDVKHDIPKALFRLFEQQKIPIEKIGKLVLTAATVWYDNSHVAYECKNGEKVNLADVFKPYFKNKIIVKNDINLAALGEKYFGVGKSSDNLLYAWVGTAIGGGIILNGQLYEGEDLSAGEFAYSVVYNPVLHTHECFRDIVDKGGIERYIMANYEKSMKSILADKFSKNDYTLLDIIKAAKSGDKFSIDFGKYVSNIAAIVVMNFAHTLNVQTVIVGGEYTLFGSSFLDEFRTLADKVPLADLKILTPQHSNSAMYGAFKAGADCVLEELWRH